MDNAATLPTLFLHRVGFSKYLPEEEFQELFKGLEIVTVTPGDVLIAQGEKGDALYLICQGRLQVYKAIAPEKSQIIAEVGVGKRSVPPSHYLESLFPSSKKAIS